MIAFTVRCVYCNGKREQTAHSEMQSIVKKAKHVHKRLKLGCGHELMKGKRLTLI